MEGVWSTAFNAEACPDDVMKIWVVYSLKMFRLRELEMLNVMSIGMKEAPLASEKFSK